MKRNKVCDYLDVVALADYYGVEQQFERSRASTTTTPTSSPTNGAVMPSAAVMLKIDALARRPRRFELPSRMLPA